MTKFRFSEWDYPSVSLSHYRSTQSFCLPRRMSLRGRSGAAGWRASTATPTTCARFQRTSPACRSSAAAGARASPPWSNPGSSRPSTAASAPWRSTTQACSGWRPCGLTATPSPASSTSKWFGPSQWCRRCRSHTQSTPTMHGSCGAVWGRIHGRRAKEGTRWRRRGTVLILRRWWSSCKGWRATSTDTSGWICQLEAWNRSPQHWAQPSTAGKSRYCLAQ